MFIYRNKKIVVHLFDETRYKHDTEKRKYLIGSSRAQRSKASDKRFVRNQENNFISKKPEIDSQNASYPEDQQQKISNTLAFVQQRITRYFVKQ